MERTGRVQGWTRTRVRLVGCRVQRRRRRRWHRRQSACDVVSRRRLVVAGRQGRARRSPPRRNCGSSRFATGSCRSTHGRSDCGSHVTARRGPTSCRRTRRTATVGARRGCRRFLGRVDRRNPTVPAARSCAPGQASTRLARPTFQPVLASPDHPCGGVVTQVRRGRGANRTARALLDEWPRPRRARPSTTPAPSPPPRPLVTTVSTR